MRNLTLQNLLSDPSPQGPCVSLYVSPTSESTTDEQLRLSLKNLIQESRRLLQKETTAEQARALMAPAEKLLRTRHWFPKTGTTAVFLSPHTSGYYKIPVRTTPLSVVSNTFHLKPIFKWRTQSRSYHLIHFQGNRATLYRGSLAGVEQVGRFLAPSLPLQAGKRYENRTGSRGAAADEAKEKKRKATRAFVREVERELVRHFLGDTTPLYVAGSKELANYYLKVTRYPYTEETPLIGTLEQIFEAVPQLVQRQLESQQKKAVARFHEALSKGLGISGLEGTARAAVSGRIADLFVAEESQIWGYLNRKSGQVRLTEERDSVDDDLLDDLAEQVIHSSGQVWVLPQQDMPNRELVSAILRW